MTRSGPSAGEGGAQGSGVADVGLDEAEAGTGRDGLKGGQVTGMGELVRHADTYATPQAMNWRVTAKLMRPAALEEVFHSRIHTRAKDSMTT
jgi:hypothetical protein